MHPLTELLKYPPIKRKTYQIPWGYDEHPDDPGLLVPDQDALDALVAAKEYLEYCSLREVADWIVKTTGRKISHTGLKHRLTFRPYEDNTRDSFKFQRPQ